MKRFWLVLLCIYLSFFGSKMLAATDSIAQLQSLGDGQTLISTNGSFELGFFRPGNSENRYLGIWYRNIPVKTIVWVANREAPVKNISGLLILNKTGNVVLLNHNKTVLWRIIPRRKTQNPVLQILDSGNLVLRGEGDDNPENYLWQSFDYPSDTLLPGMKLGKDLRTGLDRRLTAWKNENDPSPGNLTWSMDVTNYPEPMLRIGSKKYFNSGPWIGLQYSGKGTFMPHPIFDFRYFSDENEVYYMFLLVNKSIKARMVLNQTKLVRHQLAWIEAEQRWKMYPSPPWDFCDKYGACGPNGNCDEGKSPFCDCLKGFKPKSLSNWIENNYTEGCVRSEPLNCQDDGFVQYKKMKVPDTEYSLLINQSMTLMECRKKCLRSCSCMAYANSDIRGAGSGCAMWFGDLNDLRVQPDAGQDLYIRVPSSVLGTNDKHKMKIGIAVGSVTAIIFVLFLAFYFMCRRRWRITANNQSTDEEKEDLELPLFDLSKIAGATGNFSFNNMLGEGGFGPVYKGTLEDGQEIAVKRLSRTSRQGLEEFRNEVILIAKLQHRNLVKLLGCSIQNEEKLLVYEYMLNKSLDRFIFDQMQKYLLDWPKRFQIICGIAKGLLYLHQDSRLRIIHRDLKASNVLLDNEMNPKISDFGLARILGGNQTEENTHRIVGTHGYMAPEYAIDGNFSIKSDVYSFGVLLLEIVSGKKNREKYHPKESLNLIGYTWDLWMEERPEELIDECFKNSCNLSEAVRCIRISLLCLQQHPHDRPSMSSVVMMLNCETALPQPKQPGFFVGECAHDEYSSSHKNELASVNQLSITAPEAR